MDNFIEFTQEFLHSHGLSYGYYRRVYAKQYLNFSTNDAVPSSTVIDRVLPQIVNDEIKSFQHFDFLWDEYFCPSDIAMLREKYSLFHGLVTLKFYRTHYDVFSVAMRELVSFSSSFYLSHLLDVHAFQVQLTKKIDIFMKKSPEKQRFLINYTDEGDFEQLTLDIDKKYPLYDAFGNLTYLTSLEFLSIHLFAQGKSYKDIAIMFNISPRTVETYVTRAKGRTGYTAKQDILHAVRTFSSSLLMQQNLDEKMTSSKAAFA